LRNNYNILKDDNTKLLNDISQYQNRDERNESVIIGLRKQTIELQGQIKAMEKHQSGLKAEVDAEKNICQTKKNALEMATHELSHCNELICRQNKEMMVLREKIKTRTEVAINQEQFVKKIEKENLDLNGKLRMIYAEHAEQRKQHEEFGNVLTNIQQSATLMEQKYQKSNFIVE
jgi:spindle assembly abnormal protein 6